MPNDVPFRKHLQVPVICQFSLFLNQCFMSCEEAGSSKFLQKLPNLCPLREPLKNIKYQMFLGVKLFRYSFGALGYNFILCGILLIQLYGIISHTWSIVCECAFSFSNFLVHFVFWYLLWFRLTVFSSKFTNQFNKAIYKLYQIVRYCKGTEKMLNCCRPTILVKVSAFFTLIVCRI